MTLSLEERRGAKPAGPDCRSPLEPVLATFFSKPSRKS
jgi:hypothetical protein